MKEYREGKEADNQEYEGKTEFARSITIEHIKWKYNNTDKNVLDDLSLEVNKGEAIGLIGESGAGKSTLADDTIRSNIAFGLPKDEVDEELIWKLLMHFKGIKH